VTTLTSPANTLAVALSLAKLGWPVFPVKLVERDGHRDKKPLVKWLTEATTDPETIATWWTAGVPSPDGKRSTPGSKLWIGVHCGRARLIVADVDEGNGKHGSVNLATAGITIPTTFHYETGRGGQHYLFRAPAGEWTVAQNTPVRDVDIRAGHGLFVYYGPEVTDEPKLAMAPAWACVPRERAAVSTGTSFDAWVESCKPGKPGAKLQALVRQVKPEGTSHDDMLRITREIVKLGTLGKAGAPDALALARETYTRNYPSYAGAWDKAVEGSVDNWGPRRDTLDTLTRAAAENGDDVVEITELVKADPDADDEDDDDYAEDLAQRVRDMRLARDARRILAAEDSTGGDLLSRDELEEQSVDWIVESLVARASITFLVARSNTGKTFAFIDMICRMAHGMPWLGKPTVQAKTLVILGEGASGITQRIRAWCEFNGGDYETVWQWVSFVGQFNINADDQLEKVRRHAADAELIILDTYAMTSGVESEDDAALQSITLNRARSINPEAALFFTHHPRKAEEDSDRPVMRGSGAMAGAADTVMTLWRDKAYIPDDAALDEAWLAISTEPDHAGKNRNAPVETIRGLYLYNAGESAVMTQTAGEAISKWDKIIRRHLRGEMTLQDFCKAANVSERAARPKLGTSHFVIRKEGAGRRPTLYSLTANALLHSPNVESYPEPEELTPTTERKDIDG